MLGESIHVSENLEIDRRNITAGNAEFVGISKEGVSDIVLTRSSAGRALLGCVFENAGVPPTEVEHRVRDRNPTDTMLSVNLVKQG